MYNKIKNCLPEGGANNNSNYKTYKGLTPWFKIEAMSTENEEKVYEVLKKLGIPYTKHEHPPVYTVEQAEQYWEDIEGTHCKNIFLRNKKGKRHYLVILLSSKKADLKALERQLGEDRLSFASPERLMRYLRLEPGAVSPLD